MVAMQPRWWTCSSSPSTSPTTTLWCTIRWATRCTVCPSPTISCSHRIISIRISISILQVRHSNTYHTRPTWSRTVWCLTHSGSPTTCSISTRITTRWLVLFHQMVRWCTSSSLPRPMVVQTAWLRSISRTSKPTLQSALLAKMRIQTSNAPAVPPWTHAHRSSAEVPLRVGCLDSVDRVVPLIIRIVIMHNRCTLVTLKSIWTLHTTQLWVERCKICLKYLVARALLRLIKGWQTFRAIAPITITATTSPRKPHQTIKLSSEWDRTS